ncbi:MAG: [Oscillospiraceae bacterium]|nr:[FeFe] hydrogenase H-cluster radical SAM maturase HydE [Oscillospiraceae bacterium]
MEKKDTADDRLKILLEAEQENEVLREAADSVRRKIYGDKVYLRGLIEFTNICRNNCYYCGIRRDNRNINRYRLTEEEILICCYEAYALGYRTFVLQGGEDMHYKDKDICSIVCRIKSAFPDCAVTLSIGERSKESYRVYFSAGADRYLLRHETADGEHYRRLHPTEMSLENRKRCLFDLKEIGYQVGSGFMVGSPFQTAESIISDLRFLHELDPDMIGIGPYLTHRDTPFRDHENGSLSLTLKLISVLRLMFPHALIPATTALGTIHPDGREMGLRAGANVVMPNLSPVRVRKEYSLYDNKICTGEESAQCRTCLERRIESAGYRAVTDIGNVRR